jgi:hypothetical protein
MAELADAHGSGPCNSNIVEVRVLLAASLTKKTIRSTKKIKANRCPIKGIIALAKEKNLFYNLDMKKKA